MIGRGERARWARAFGVTPEQIQRDHLISHLLAGLAADPDPDEVFYGGTALCRSHLEGTRLSEDIDLLHPDPSARAEAIERTTRVALRRDFPDLTWSWIERGAGRASGTVATADVAPIRFDIRRPEPGNPWDITSTEVHLRYADLPTRASLRCPGIDSFVGMKMSAWVDRKAPRDLFDLAGLARIGAVTHTAQERYRDATGVRFLEVEFESVPSTTELAWQTELGAQVGELPTAAECAAAVLAAVTELRFAAS